MVILKDVNFEAWNKVHRNLTIFKSFNMKLLYAAMYQQREDLVRFLL